MNEYRTYEPYALKSSMGYIPTYICEKGGYYPICDQYGIVQKIFETESEALDWAKEYISNMPLEPRKACDMCKAVLEDEEKWMCPACDPISYKKEAS